MKFSLILLSIVLFLAMTTRSQEKPATYDLPPAWASEAIWYQIFVERFCNGDDQNDPTPQTIKTHSDFFKVPASWRITPWTQNWYRQEDWAKETGGTLDQTLQLRRYGGDLQGVLNKLDYLSELGVNALYLNPINDAPSLHKYDARNFHHVDVNFGPDPIGDLEIISKEDPSNPETWKWTLADSLFLKLVTEAHKRNMKIILDYSWNHTGVEFWAFRDLEKNQSNSKFSGWYDVLQFDDPSTTTGEFSYRGWLDIASLPEIKKVEIKSKRRIGHPYEGDINQDAKAHIFAVTKRWLAPDGNVSNGIDGFRLDVADHIGMKFWRDYHKFVKSINPEAYLVGEIWWENYPDRLMNPVPYISGDVFDAVMFYQLYRPAKYFFSKSDYSMDARQFKDSLQYQWSRLEKPFRYAMMNVASSHDSPRLLTCFNNPGKYKYKAKNNDDPSYKSGKPDGQTYKRVKLYLIHQFTNVGAPHIWNGDELGMWGADDPDCRKPLWWPEKNFEFEVQYNSEGKILDSSQVIPNKALLFYYKTLIRLRKENQVLSHGEIKFLEMEGKSISYKRYDDSSEILVLLNAGYNSYTFHFSKNTYLDVFSNKTIETSEMEVPPLNGVVLKKLK